MQSILVVYASRSGSTAEVAQAIGEQLCRRGETVDVRSVEAVKDLSPYRAVILGSAVRMGRWLPAAVKFVEQHQAALRQVPVAYFTVHILATDDSEASRKQRAGYLDGARALVVPQQEAFFAGRIDPAKLGLGERLLAKAVSSPEGDMRDWQAIRGWADQVFKN